MTGSPGEDVTVATTVAAALTEDEGAALDAAEQVIAAGMKTFVKVGNALLSIRDARLYRTTYPTFEDYCQQRWGLGRNYVNKVIAATEIAATIADALGTAVPIPENERQVRELAPFRDAPEVATAVWQAAVDSAGGRQPSSTDVREAVSRLNEISDTAESVPLGRERSAPQPARRRPFPPAIRTAVWELRKAADRLERLTNDDRFPWYAGDFRDQHRGDLEHIVGVLEVIYPKVAP